LPFEPNRGQAERDVDYVARGKAYSVSLKSGEAVLALGKSGSGNLEALHLKMLGGRRKITAAAAAQLPGYSNYIFGRNPAAWIQNLPQFARVEYADVYPGVDLVYYGNQRQLEYDFL